MKIAVLVELSKSVAELLLAIYFSLDGARHIHQVEGEGEFFGQIQVNQTNEWRAIDDGDTQLFLPKSGE